MACKCPLGPQAAKSGEDDDNDESDSDDDDDVKVTIGNIKTGAPSYMCVCCQFFVWPVGGALL